MDNTEQVPSSELDDFRSQFGQNAGEFRYRWRRMFGSYPAESHVVHYEATIKRLSEAARTSCATCGEELTPACNACATGASK